MFVARMLEGCLVSRLPGYAVQRSVIVKDENFGEKKNPFSCFLAHIKAYRV